MPYSWGMDLQEFIKIAATQGGYGLLAIAVFFLWRERVNRENEYRAEIKALYEGELNRRKSLEDGNKAELKALILSYEGLLREVVTDLTLLNSAVEESRDE